MGLIMKAYIFHVDDKAPSNNTVISREKENKENKEGGRKRRRDITQQSN